MEDGEDGESLNKNFNIKMAQILFILARNIYQIATEAWTLIKSFQNYILFI